MGYVPEWQRASHAKAGTTQKQTGVRCVELFHNASKPSQPTKRFADGGEVNAKGETMGEYSGNDDIVKYRMNQIDDKGADLRIPTSAKTTQSQMDAQDMENGSGSTPKASVEVKAAPASTPARVSKPAAIESGPSSDDRLRSKYGRADHQAIAQDKKKVTHPSQYSQRQQRQMLAAQCLVVAEVLNHSLPN